jgi:cell division protein FtsQ
MSKTKIVSIEDRIPKIKQHRKKKANRRLLLLLSLFLLLICSIVYFQSSLSHVQSVDVKGNELLQTNEIIKTSGIQIGDNVWGISKKSVVAKLEKKTEIKQVKVNLVFPNKILIQIQEFEKEAYLVEGNKFHIILENGKVLPQSNSQRNSIDAPLLKGFQEDPTLLKMIKELNELPEKIQHLISEITLEPKKTDPLHISLFMNDGFEVSATIRTFSDKMVHYPSIASQIAPSRKGVIDLEVGSYFRDYEMDGVENEEGESER